MKKIFTFVILLTLVAFPQQLKKSIGQSYTSTSAISFADQNTGYMAGTYEAIYKTTDGGNNWERLNYVQGSNITYSAVTFFSPTTGYIAGGSSSLAVLKKTIDGGTTWTDITLPAKYALKDMKFINEQVGWVLSARSDTGVIFKTVDGGANWTQVLLEPVGDLEAIDILPSGKGVAVGGRVGVMQLYYTADGTTWTKAAVPSLGGFTYTRIDVHAVDFVNENMVYAVGWGSSIGAQPTIMLKSTDAGATWTYMTQTPENRTYQNMNAVYFKDENNGLAFGGGGYEGSIVLKTTDGGVNWIQQSTKLGFTIDGVYSINDVIYFIGGDGNVGKTTDFGGSFNLLTNIPGGSLRTIKVVDNNTIYAAGFGGIFLKSTNRGITWSGTYAATEKVCPNANGLSVVDNTTIFLARGYKQVTKSTDGGSTWNYIMKDTNTVGFTNEGIYFFNQNKGFVAGRVASNTDVIYSTVDGGLNWASTNLTANEDLYFITFFDENNGIAVGNDSKIIYTANGGTTWQLATTDAPGDFDLKSAAYLTSTKIIVVGEKCFLLSEDGGLTFKFKTIEGLTSTLEGIAFKTAEEGITVGGKFIFKTIDGGSTWTNINDTLVTLNNSFYDVTYDQNGDFWIVGGGSSIYTNSTYTDVNEPSLTPTEFSLYQNYPNPFNPSTMIKFSVASEVKVSLRVYDILGNLVSELLNDNKPAGEYQIEFNASKLSSGIYFCVMNAGGKMFTQKMSLIK